MYKQFLLISTLIVLLLPFSTYAESKHISKITIGANLNSQVKPLGIDGDVDFLDVDGFSFFINRTIPIGAIEAGFEFETYEQEIYFFVPIKYEMDIRIFSLGYNIPIQLPLGIQIIPGLRCGLYSPKMTISGFGESESDSEAYTFIGFATRAQIDIIKGFGVYLDSSVKRVDSEDDLLKVQAGLKYTF